MNIFLSDNQITKIKSAIKNNESITLRLKKDKTPNTKLPFTPKMNANGTYTFNKSQLKQMGGFLPLLLAAAPIIAKAVGVGAATYAGSQLAKKITGSGLKYPKGSGLKYPKGY